jgi:cobalt/nickel transport protein
MRRPLLLLLTAVLLAAPLVRAHYPMLIVDKPFLAAGDPVTIDFTIGHPYVNDRFPAERPTRVRVFTPVTGPQDLTARVTTETVTFQDQQLQSHRLTYTPRRTGDYVFSWELRLFTEPPRRQVIDFAKVIVHVGEDQIGWWHKVGTPIEIVPLTRPYAIKVGDTFRGQVFEGRGPMMGGVVEGETYTDVMPYPAPELAFTRRAERTDPNGVFSMTLDRAGWWLLSVATDGGPGEQGGLEHPAQRAVLWVFVGGP